MKKGAGSFMYYVKMFGVMIFSLLMFLTSPQLLRGAGVRGNSLPSINISYPLAKRLITPYTLITPYREIFLEGKVICKAGIKKIELNGKKLFNISDMEALAEKFTLNNKEPAIKKIGSELSKKTIKQNREPQNLKQILKDTIQEYNLYHLNQIYPLKDGTNLLDLLVEDNSGNTASKHLTIRNIPLDTIVNSNSQHRMTVALVPLVKDVDYQIDIQDYIYHRLLESFTRQARFNIVERKKLPWLLIEKAIQTKDTAQRDSDQIDIARQIGHITRAEGIIFAELQKVDNGIEIVGRFVNVEIMPALFLHKVFAPIKDLKSNKDFEELNRILTGLTIKFRDSFPLCTGTVTAKNGRIIEVDLGAHEGIFPGMGYNIYMDNIDKDKDGLELISKAIIEKVAEDSSKARIPDGEKSWGIERGYRVSTR